MDAGICVGTHGAVNVGWELMRQPVRRSGRILGSSYLLRTAAMIEPSSPFLYGSMLARAQTMRSRFEEIQRKHRGESGRQREDDVRDFLVAFLPARLGIQGGEIVDSTGSQSPAIDLIVYDAMNTPLLDETESSVVVPIEGVFGVVEVSSRLDSRKLRTDAEKIRAVKNMPKCAYFNPPWPGPIERTFNVHGPGFETEQFPVQGYCFAYDSANIPTLAKTLESIDDPDEPRCNLDMVCSLSKGVIGNGVEDKPTPFGAKWRGAAASDAERLPLRIDPQGVPGGALIVFYMLMASVLMQAETPAIRIAQYLTVD